MDTTSNLFTPCCACACGVDIIVWSLIIQELFVNLLRYNVTSVCLSNVCHVELAHGLRIALTLQTGIKAGREASIQYILFL